MVDNDKVHYIVMLGADTVGKSTLMYRAVAGKFVEEFDPAIEDCYRKLFDIDRCPTVIEFLDNEGTILYSTSIHHCMSSMC